MVGSNIRSLDNSQAPQAIGYGVAVLPTPALVLAADGLTRFTADSQTGRKGTSAMVGASYTLFGKMGLRAGGGYDAATGNGYATLGLSAISDIGALDGGVRQDLFRSQDAPACPARARPSSASACGCSSRPPRPTRTRPLS